MSILLLQKPSRSSKSRDHTTCLERRLKTWKAGDFDNLLLEGRTIQQRLGSRKRPQEEPDQLARAFSNLMLKGNTKAALRLISEGSRGGILHLSDTALSHGDESQSVLDILKSKHPSGQPVDPTTLVDKVNDPPATLLFLTASMGRPYAQQPYALKEQPGLQGLTHMDGGGYVPPLSLPPMIFAIH